MTATSHMHGWSSFNGDRRHPCMFQPFVFVFVVVFVCGSEAVTEEAASSTISVSVGNKRDWRFNPHNKPHITSMVQRWRRSRSPGEDTGGAKR